MGRVTVHHTLLKPSLRDTGAGLEPRAKQQFLLCADSL